MNHTDIFLGISILQFVYIAYQFILLRRPEYLYYLLYFTGISLVVFFKIYPDYNPFRVFVLPDESFSAGRGLWFLSIAFYFRFGRYFTDIVTLHKKLNRQLLFAEWFLIGYGIIDILSQAYGVDYMQVESYSKWVFYSIIPFSVYVIIFLLAQGRILTNILVTGSLLLLAFGVASLLIVQFTGGALPESEYQLFTELGVISELLFLNFGLIYKTRVLEKDNIRKEVEKQIELNRQRSEISRDLHDEMGATLSGIALYSHLANDQLNAEQKSGLQQTIAVIRESSSEMVNKLNDIIWSVDPGHDDIGQMMEHLEEYLVKMASAKNIISGMTCDKELEKFPLPMEFRKDIYLICKESVNNAVKYAGAGKIQLRAYASDKLINFSVEDDGKGFDESSITPGKGLFNMRNRAKVMGAGIQILSKPGAGTRIVLSLNSDSFKQ